MLGGVGDYGVPFTVMKVTKLTNQQNYLLNSNLLRLGQQLIT